MHNVQVENRIGTTTSVIPHRGGLYPVSFEDSETVEFIDASKVIFIDLVSRPGLLKLFHPKGHAYWNRNEFKVLKDTGEFVYPWKFSKYHGQNGEAFEIKVKAEGIFVQYYLCSSGLGKHPYGEEHLLVDSSEYDEIEYIGQPLEMCDTLKKDIEDNFPSFK